MLSIMKTHPTETRVLIWGLVTLATTLGLTIVLCPAIGLSMCPLPGVYLIFWSLLEVLDRLGEI